MINKIDLIKEYLDVSGLSMCNLKMDELDYIQGPMTDLQNNFNLASDRLLGTLTGGNGICPCLIWALFLLNRQCDPSLVSKYIIFFQKLDYLIFHTFPITNFNCIKDE